MSIWNRIFSVVLICSSLQWVEASSRSSVWEQQRSLEAVGVQTIEYQDARRHRPVVVELWYPIGSTHDDEKELRNEPLLKKKLLSS